MGCLPSGNICNQKWPEVEGVSWSAIDCCKSISECNRLWISFRYLQFKWLILSVIMYKVCKICKIQLSHVTFSGSCPAAWAEEDWEEADEDEADQSQSHVKHHHRDEDTSTHKSSAQLRQFPSSLSHHVHSSSLQVAQSFKQTSCTSGYVELSCLYHHLIHVSG